MAVWGSYKEGEPKLTYPSGPEGTGLASSVL